MNAHGNSLTAFYVAAVVSGIGAGCVYGTAVGNALKWFPDKRGLAAGLTAAGFGAGAAITVIPIANMIQRSGYEHTFQFFGIAQGVVIFVLALLLVRPRPPQGTVASRRVASVKQDFTTSEMIKTPVFWVIYALFVAVAAGGLMATAQMKPIAADYGIAKLPISTLFGGTLPLLTVVLSLDSLCNGFTRPITGFISDFIGRENTMFVVFVGEGLALLGLLNFGHEPVMFMIFAPMVFLFWGEIFSIFPATCADTFGIQNAAGNAGALYTAKGTAALIVPIASLLSPGGYWNRVFLVSAIIAIGAGFAAKFILAPMRSHFIDQTNQHQD
jgi:OFA family oxalate/formate antiporter-like MFS transporter